MLGKSNYALVIEKSTKNQLGGRYWKKSNEINYHRADYKVIIT